MTLIGVGKNIHFKLRQKGIVSKLKFKNIKNHSLLFKMTPPNQILNVLKNIFLSLFQSFKRKYVYICLTVLHFIAIY